MSVTYASSVTGDSELMPPPQFPHQHSIQSEKSVRDAADMLSTRDVIKTYIVFRLYEDVINEGHTEMEAFDFKRPLQLVDLPAIRVLFNIAKSYRMFHYTMGLSHSLIAVVAHVKGYKEARSQYADKITSLFFHNEGTSVHPQYKLKDIIMCIVATGELVDCILDEGDLIRVGDIIEWCISLFRSWQVDKWVMECGGWSKLLINECEAKFAAQNNLDCKEIILASGLALGTFTPLSLEMIPEVEEEEKQLFRDGGDLQFEDDLYDLETATTLIRGDMQNDGNIMQRQNCVNQQNPFLLATLI